MKVVDLKQPDCDDVRLGLKNVLEEIDERDESIIVIRDRGDGVVLHGLGRPVRKAFYALGLVERAKFVLNAYKIGDNVEE